MKGIFWGVATAAVLAQACNASKQVATSPGAENEAAQVRPEEQTQPGHDNLNAVLWMQSSAEYAALAHQAYTTGQLALDEAIEDPTWTASVEQQAAGGYEDLPPAVVLDLDETVLDNSAYQARLVKSGETYNSDTWRAWTEEAAARVTPGATVYLREVANRGVEVVYITNRRSGEEEATRRNLAALGLPLSAEGDHVLTRGERAEWSDSDKTLRREAVAQQYRIIQLVGDNLGDFVEAKGSLTARAEVIDRYRDYWGMRWIVIPNPSYGSWESALFGDDYSKSPAQRRAEKLKALRSE